VSAILKPRRPPSPTPRSDAALPDAAACCDAPPPLRPGALAPARGPRPPVRGHHRPHAFSRGLLSDTCTLHAAWSLPTASFYACVASAACCDSEAMRVPCVVRVVCTRRGVTVRDNGISVNQYFLNQQYFHITLIVTLSVMVWV
jgi:hypothetical protein